MSRHDISDPITIASVLVRDHLETVIQRQHLPGEAKQARADRA